MKTNKSNKRHKTYFAPGSFTLAIEMNFSIILARCFAFGGKRIMVPTQDEIKLKWAMQAWNAAEPFLVFHT